MLNVKWDRIAPYPLTATFHVHSGYVHRPCSLVVGIMSGCCLSAFSLNSQTISASNVSHTVVLRPLKAGYFNFTSASVSYLAQEGGLVVVRLLLFIYFSLQNLIMNKKPRVLMVFVFSGGLHKCPWPRGNSSPEGVRSPLLSTLCECLFVYNNQLYSVNAVYSKCPDVWIGQCMRI